MSSEKINNEHSSTKEATEDVLRRFSYLFTQAADPPSLRASLTSPPQSSRSEQSGVEFVAVDTLPELRSVVDTLGKYTHLAMDAEGVDLGRHGALTLLSLVGFNLTPTWSTTGVESTSPAFLVDVQVLGQDCFEASGLGGLLHTPRIKKVCFDCRADSDALYHQFRILLSGVIDLQVYDQAVRFQSGEHIPIPPRSGRKPFVKGMKDISYRYMTHTERNNLQMDTPGPHKLDMKVWGKRPLAHGSFAYAATDVYAIALLMRRMHAFNISSDLERAVLTGSQTYVDKFRTRATPVTWDERDFIMVERPILVRYLLTRSDRDANQRGQVHVRAEQLSLRLLNLTKPSTWT